jgi:hypothetical protein
MCAQENNSCFHSVFPPFFNGPILRALLELFLTNSGHLQAEDERDSNGGEEKIWRQEEFFVGNEKG